jgi:Glyoxalase-like domain
VVKNRVHWDVDLPGAGPAALVAAGARILRGSDDEIRWWVLADPEGNEFCAFAA